MILFTRLVLNVFDNLDVMTIYYDLLLSVHLCTDLFLLLIIMFHILFVPFVSLKLTFLLLFTVYNWKPEGDIRTAQRAHVFPQLVKVK